MIDDEELKFRRIKFEQVQSKIKTNTEDLSGRLGPRRLNIGTKNQKIDNIFQGALKNLGN